MGSALTTSWKDAGSDELRIDAHLMKYLKDAHFSSRLDPLNRHDEGTVLRSSTYE